jgi:hypothetical protein
LNGQARQQDSGPHVINSIELASDKKLINYQAGVPVYFVGYPSHTPSKIGYLHPEIDVPVKYPLLRQGIFSTPPILNFDVEGAIGGPRYSWLDSFAVSGFSGSPIFVPQFGWSTDEHGREFSGVNNRRMLVGMVCGDQEIKEERAHTGLSYFVNSHHLLHELDISAAAEE